MTPVTQASHQSPHVATQFHIDARRRLVKEEYFGLVGQSLGNSSTRRFMPPDRVMILLSRLSQKRSQVAQ